MNRQGTFFKPFKDRVLLFDGAMGSLIQTYPLTIDDFEGNEGCNEYLVKTRPEIIQAIHAAYFDAGADVVETDSFGSTSVVLAEYDLQDQAYELNVRAARIAKEVASGYTDRPRFVAGSIGPTTKLPTLGHIGYRELKASFFTQVQGLVDGGADILLIETCQDLLQTKAALAAIHDLQKQLGREIPTIVQVTIEATGTMLVGMDIASVVTAIQPYGIDAIGMNCATGPQEMSEHVRYLSQNSPFLISCLPNAGIPENVGGKAHYKLTPDELAQHLTHFVKDLGVSIVGGCCGTTPDHIRKVYEAISGLSPLDRKPAYQNGATSLYSSVPFKIDQPPLIIGERTNANGSKKFRDLLAENDYDGLVSIGKSQVAQGAHLLDVCTAYVGRDEVKDMEETVRRFNSQLDVPLVIDSTEAPVLRRALELIAGKAVVNSINLEDGEERLEQVLPLCAEFGAAVVALTIDETGMAKTAQRKLEVAQRIYDLSVNRYGIQPQDLIFDTLTFTIGSGDEEFRRAGIETIDAIRLIKQAHPEVSTILGISNISFGLKPAVRHVLNSMFLHYALEAGLDMAILNSAHILPLHRISEEERELCRKLIFDERTPEFDPLMALIAYYEANDASSTGGGKQTVLPETVEERLKYRIVEGEKTGLSEDLTEALQRYKALEIINDILLDGMKTVGDLFGRGEMQLPFVLQSAEVMKTAVAFLEPHMEKADLDSAKGTIVLATVKGDVHDIGKNLVDILLTNNGYKVINLGIKQPIETILHAVDEHKADAVGMSGLLVKSTAIMKENLAVMQERGLHVPVLLGGAALTRRFVEEDCQNEYVGRVFYASDAFSGLHAMEAVMGSQAEAPVKAPAQVPVSEEEPVYQAVGEVRSSRGGLPPDSPEYTRRSPEISEDVPIPAVPFFGTRVVTEIPLEEIYPYLNTRALVSGQWQVKRGERKTEEHEQFLQEKIYPVLERLKADPNVRRAVQPQVVYGYFPCQSGNNDLIIYEDDARTERLRFTFPRGGARRLCLADFFAPKTSGRTDVIAMQIVSLGQQATEYARTLFEAGQYTEYFYFHGFSVELTEALAEYWHKRLRQEWGIAAQDAPDLARLLAKGYQGCRYSFGYPACPNLEDQAGLFTLLEPERIGVRLTEEFMLDPEHATSAIVLHHPQARYFDVRENS